MLPEGEGLGILDVIRRHAVSFKAAAQGHQLPSDLDRLQTELTGRYHIERELGVGGMATVYLAQDLRHDRPVAIKVMREEFGAALGPERFLSEIRVTAGLQHPNILPLFDSGSAAGLLYYVMPYVAGESLAALLVRERELPLERAVALTRAIAGALDYAHRAGVLHRDIKPENILLHDGQPLVADFGLALALHAAGADRLTRGGLAVGTPQYMSPEQASGERDLDARSDIYSLGVLLYEMLTGEPPFLGATTHAIVVKVIAEPPLPPSRLRSQVPPGLEAAVLKALEKSPADRWASAGEFAAALTGPAPRRLGRAAVVGIGGVALIAVALWGWLGRSPRGARTAATRRTSVTIQGQPESRNPFGTVTLSADGRSLIHAGTVGSTSQLYRRQLDALTSTPIEGTAGALSPFLSPDGARLGFLRGAGIVTLPTSGGGAPTFASVRPSTSGVPTWTEDGRILFTLAGGGLAIVRPDGTGLDTLTRPEPGVAHLSPRMLPGGDRIVFTAARGALPEAAILTLSLGNRAAVEVVVKGALTPEYDQGHLLFVRPNRTLVAAPFDPKRGRLTGEPVPLGDEVGVSGSGVAHYVVASGTVLYQRPSQNRLVELDRVGRRSPIAAELGAYHHPRYSGDGARIVLDRTTGGTRTERDAWLYDRASRTMTRLTVLGDGNDPGWLAGGRGFSVRSTIAAGGPLFVLPAGAGATVTPIPTPANLVRIDIRGPPAWLPDGRGFVVVVAQGAANQIWLVTRPDSPAVHLVPSDTDEHSPAVSPDGKLLAYVSDETGRREVYLLGLANGERIMVSTAGGQEPAWEAKGSALYYVDPSGERPRLIAATVAALPRPRVITRRVVFEEFQFLSGTIHANYDVAPDGSRFIAIEEVPNPPIIAITDWLGALAARPPKG